MVEQYYPDRLYLHPRAVRALKSAVYQNPSMVYRCLILLAEDYYDYRMGRINRDTFLQRCAKVDPGLSECGFGGASDILEQGDEYYITYGGKRVYWSRHLKKGVNHNASNLPADLFLLGRKKLSCGDWESAWASAFFSDIRKCEGRGSCSPFCHTISDMAI